MDGAAIMKKITDKQQEVIGKMFKVKNFFGTRRAKYRRNLRMFEYSPTVSIDSLSDNEVVGYYQQGRFDIEEDTTSSIQENVIRSCIDTLVSKIASQKVRPFFNTVNGSFKDMQVAKQAQDYFDSIYDEQNVNKTVVKAFQDACIFDTGWIYIDNKEKLISRVLPWQVYVDPREASYNKLTQIVWCQEQFPSSLLPIKTPRDLDTVTYWQYWDLNAKKHYYYIPELELFEEEKWEYNAIPFISINYATPVKGTSCQSIVDLLYGIQMEIDALLTKIKDASQLASPLKYFVPESSSIKVKKLSNRVGEIITYTPSPNQSANPITTVTEPFMDSQWLNLLQQLRQDAYECVGISQLSATSQKPSGLNSGIALSTMEDIESSRFETQLNTIVRAYVDIARLIIQIFPEDEDILPPNRLRKSMSWADIVEARDRMTIQFSAANALSKDPSTKLQQLQALYAAGLIPQERIAQLMDLPDLQLGQVLQNNALNAILTVIDDCIERDIYDVPDYIPTQQLLKEIANTQLSLKAASTDNDEDINKLYKLMEVVSRKEMMSQTSAELNAYNGLMNEVNMQMQPGGSIANAMNQGSELLGSIQAGEQTGDFSEAQSQLTSTNK